ncbi:MBL fold metallo-hydrolase [Methanobacterium sp. CWC-01]|uniref:MBL fold metallo-hydrolase n=1 Tax=Methanobacterium aridiramus TaxID=2584467 RepID=UPI0025771466|nr:MBL fold metallo-hydrolase [Methanobacterium sp. CWC-01]WJI10063.1 MBL fold metallo-hydrolase [Methanobacterium sp. CWC-01]
MRIIPLAFESMGVRSMATYVETDQKILIDPGTALGPKRFGFPPWKTELEALYRTRAEIQKHARNTDIVTISHYHHDHFTPFQLGKYLDSSPRYAAQIYDNKLLFIKDPTSKINQNQKKRARNLLKNLVNSKISYADGKSFQVGDTNLKFSDPLPHGPEGSRMGYLIALTIRCDDETFMHASDVQGPIFKGTRDYILQEKPDTLILSGPPLYLVGFALGEKDLEMARENLIKIVDQVPRVVVDHHLLRDLRYAQFLESVVKESGGEVLVASQLIGEEPCLLEARRKELYYPKNR